MKVLVAGGGCSMPLTVDSLLRETQCKVESARLDEFSSFMLGRIKPDILVVAKYQLAEHDFLTIQSLFEPEQQIPVLVVSLAINEEQMIRLIRSGVRGLLTVDSELPLLYRAIKALIAGELWCPRNLFNIVLQSYQGGNGDENIRPLKQGSLLSKRERQVLTIMSQGKTNQEIADQLGISYSTIVNHSNNIYRKLEVSNRTAAVQAATALGLLEV